MFNRKSLLKNFRNGSIIVATVLSCWLTQGSKLLALPQAEIVEKLNRVPVFTIVDEKGTPLVATVTAEDKTGKVAGVFISKEDANSFMEKIKKENPELAKQVQVVLIPLGEIYQVSQDKSKEEEQLNLAYVPAKTQVDLAKKISTDYKGGVPLFAAKLGEDQGYLVIKQNETEVIPFFFEKAQVNQLIENFKKAQPDLAKDVTIEVVPLEGMLATLEQDDNEMLKKIVILPSQETMELVRSIQQQQQQQEKK